MNWKKHFLEGLTLVGAAVVCALVANGIAARERKLVLVGTYLNALKVPAQTQAAPPAPLTATVTTTPVERPATSPGVDRRVARRSAPPPVAPKPDLSKFSPHPDKPYVEIGFADVKALRDSGALVLDARRTAVYDQGHIAGARPFSVWESDVDEKVKKLFDERGDPRDQAKPIVIYCSGGDCEDSHMLSQKLWGIQFNNVYVYKDGFPDWQSKGGPVRTGSNP